MSQQPSKQLWGDVDTYFENVLMPHDPVLEAALEANRAAGLAEIDVAPNQGKLLYLLALMSGAKKILELGTLGAYSTIWLARATGEAGHVTTLELDERHATIARSNLQHAELDGKVQVRVGPAIETLAELQKENAGPFDLIFIDADKPNNPKYLDWSLKLSRVGTIIIMDNVVRNGAVVDGESQDPRVQGTRSMFDMIKDNPHLDATAVQTVGSKGWDGFALARVVKTKA